MLEVFMLPLALVSVLVVLLYLYLTSNFNYWRKRGVPGPKPTPLLGSFPTAMTGKRNFVYDLDDIYREFKHKTKFVGVFMTRNPQLMVIDPELTKDVLITNFKNFMDNESSQWVNKDVEKISVKNPFIARGAEWKTKRSEIVPGLTMSKIKGMYPVISRASKELTKFLKHNPEDCAAGVETKDVALKFTGEVVADLGWGIEANAFEKGDCTFVDMAKKMVNHSLSTVSFFFIVGIFPIVKKFYTQRFFPLVTDNFFIKLTEMSLDMRKSSNERQDFLNHLVQLREKKNLSTVDLTAHNVTFLLDGFETSAALISHSLLLLSRNPEVQEKLRKELQDNSEEDGSISFDDLSKLPYLDQVLHETLRIFTPLAFMSKICTEPCELTNIDGSKYTVQKDEIVLISLYSYHHDEDYFPEPDKFIPERFDEENGGIKKFKDLGVFFPFGDGPRICLGMKFGLSVAKVGVSEVIRNFQLTEDTTRTVPGHTFDEGGFILNLKGGIHIRYKELMQ